MYLKRKSNVIFRNYGDFGYITDNRNFGYGQVNNEGNDIGDKIVSQSGAVFFSALDQFPQTFDSLIEQINKQFVNVDKETIKKDALVFFGLLEEDGFVISGDSIQECQEKDFHFSYKKMETQELKVGCSKMSIIKKSTQDFFDEYFQNKPQLTNLHIEIASQCNERCIHCYIPHEYKIKSMDADLFYSILEQCKNMNLLHLTISGGEPMLHDNFIDFLKKCHEYNFSINVLSNLTLLNENIIDEMSKNPLLSVQTSLYATDKSIHDGITQKKGSCEKTKESILKLIENNIPLQISCPIMRTNKEDYTDVLKWGKIHNINVGSDYVIIGGYDHTNKNLNCRLSINEAKKLICDKIDDDPNYLVNMEKESEKKKVMNPDDFICSVCHSSICIAENGNVYPCAGWQGYLLGNINKTSLFDIWNKSEKVQYLRNLRRRDFPKCIECSDREYCTMCMVRNSNENPLGDPLTVNEYFCNIAKMTKAIVQNRII